MPLAGARTKEDVDSIMEKTYEEVYEFGKRMGDRYGRTLIKTGMVRGEEATNVLAQLGVAFGVALKAGAKEGTKAQPAPPNLVLTTVMPSEKELEALEEVDEDDGEEEEQNEEEYEPEPEPVAPVKPQPMLPPSPRSDPNLVFPKNAGQKSKEKTAKKPIVCPKCGFFCKNQGAFTLHLWNSHKTKYSEYISTGGIPAEKLAMDYEKQQAISTEKRNSENETHNSKMLATLRKQADKYASQPVKVDEEEP